MDSPSENRLRSVVVAGEVKRSHSHKSKKRSRIDDGVSREDFRELRSNVEEMRSEFLKLSQALFAARDDRGSVSPPTRGSVSSNVSRGSVSSIVSRGSVSSKSRGSVSSKVVASVPEDAGSDPECDGFLPNLDDLAEINLGLELEGEDLDGPPDTLNTDADMDPPEDSDDLSVVLEGAESAGPPISVSLAEYVTTCSTKRIEREHLKSLRQKVKRPEKCPQVVAPPVNPVIWRELDKFQRTRDVHLQTAQELLVKGLLTVVQVKEKLMEASKSSSDPLSKELSSACSTAIALLGNASLESSFRRRDLLRSAINRRYHALCGNTTPVGKYLFGDKIADDLKEINEANRVSKGVVQERHQPPSSAPNRSFSHTPQGQSSSRPLNWSGRHGPHHRRPQFNKYRQHHGPSRRPPGLSSETTKKST